MSKPYVDLHCHPSLKPYGRSFKRNFKRENNTNRKKKNSIWYQNTPNFFQLQINHVLGLTKFTQTDLTTLAKANCEIVIISLYPFEKHFIKKHVLGIKWLANAFVNLAAGISMKRIKHLRNHNSYFTDLVDEYNFYLQSNNLGQKIDGVDYTYRLVKNFSDIENNLNQNTEKRKIINLVVSIEGAHAFETGLSKNSNTANEIDVLNNIETVKQWEHKPLFVTFAHHFYNELCGHAKSLEVPLIKNVQLYGLDTGFTDLGLKAINKLLDNTNNNRILIDIKHMSRKSREVFYQLLETDNYKNENIPIVVSHGALTGRKSLNEIDYKTSKHSVQFNDKDINFYDSELVRIAKSGGIFGIQLDERRIGSKKAILNSKVYFPSKGLRIRSKAQLIWRQIEHCAIILNSEGLFCWGTLAVGSDFDGIVNPIKGLWTSKYVNDFRAALITIATNYLIEKSQEFSQENQITAEEIIDRFLHVNATNFLKRHF